MYMYIIIVLPACIISLFLNYKLHVLYFYNVINLDLHVDLLVPVLNLLEVPVLEYDLNLASSTTAQHTVTKFKFSSS